MIKWLLAVGLSSSILTLGWSTVGAAPFQASSPAQSDSKTQPKPEAPTATGRPTSESDPVQKFNQNYFVGVWRFEGTLAESPLGEGGPITGTETVRNGLDGRFWDIAIEGEGPEGAFSGKGVLLFQDSFAGQSVVRHEITRGVGMLSFGTVGCDLGGSCGMHYETPPFESKGSRVQLRGRYIITGRFAYRVTREISVDRGPFTNLGTVAYRRDAAAAAPKAIK